MNIPFEKILTELNPETLINYAQKLPAESVALLEAAAKAKGISLELEIVSRLVASFINPAAFGLDLLCEAILKTSYTSDEAFAECRRNKLANLYEYELEKLKLVMGFEGKLPRDFKESFRIIDVKKARKLIKAELEAEAKQNQSENNNKTGE